MIEMTNHLQNAISALYNVRTWKNSEVQSPHKFIFLLTLLKMYEAYSDRENKFSITIELPPFLNSCLKSWNQLSYMVLWRRGGGNGGSP